MTSVFNYNKRNMHSIYEREGYNATECILQTQSLKSSPHLLIRIVKTSSVVRVTFL
jgi:hypothetical protein